MFISRLKARAYSCVHACRELYGAQCTLGIPRSGIPQVHNGLVYPLYNTICLVYSLYVYTTIWCTVGAPRSGVPSVHHGLVYNAAVQSINKLRTTFVTESGNIWTAPHYPDAIYNLLHLIPTQYKNCSILSRRNIWTAPAYPDAIYELLQLIPTQYMKCFILSWRNVWTVPAYISRRNIWTVPAYISRRNIWIVPAYPSAISEVPHTTATCPHCCNWFS